jgi:hypothetical protein
LCTLLDAMISLWDTNNMTNLGFTKQAQFVHFFPLKHKSLRVQKEGWELVGKVRLDLVLVLHTFKNLITKVFYWLLWLWNCVDCQ